MTCRPPLPPARARRPRAAALVCLLALFAPACGDGTPPAPPARPPNVLLVVIDTLRAQNLSCYGYPWQTSPNIDALAARGTLFENCTAQAAWTMPSMISMMTGLPIFSVLYKIPQDFPVLAESFRQAGYRTGAFVANSVLGAEDGFARGFDVFRARQPMQPHWSASDVNFGALAFLDGRLGRPDARGGGGPDGAEATAGEPRGGAGAGGRAGADAVAEQPFLLWLHYLDPHAPYAPPEPAFARNNDEVFTDFERELHARTVAAAPGDQRPHLESETAALYDEIDRYDGEIRALDTALGTLFAELEKRGLLQDTIVLLASDHGETLFRRPETPERTQQMLAYREQKGLPVELGDYVKREHDGWVYEELVRTPLVVAGPGIAAGRSRALVSNLDILPTLLGLAGLPVPEGLQGRDLSGPLRRGDAVPDARWATSFASHGVCAKTPDGRKLVLPGRGMAKRHGAEPMLFDLTTDPYEQHPLPLDDDARVLLDRLQRAQAADPFARFLQTLDADTHERLLEMGYLGPGR